MIVGGDWRPLVGVVYKYPAGGQHWVCQFFIVRRDIGMLFIAT